VQKPQGESLDKISKLNNSILTKNRNRQENRLHFSNPFNSNANLQDLLSSKALPSVTREHNEQIQEKKSLQSFILRITSQIGKGRKHL
jgi:hypothetical protein